MSRRCKWLHALLLALSLLATAAVAAQGEPVKISADSLELDQKNQSTTYSGNVLLTQGEMRLTADSLTVFVKNGKLGHIEAHGEPAHFDSRLKDGTAVVGEARELRFDSTAGLLTLIGNSRLVQGQNRIENDFIEYDLNRGNLKAGGKKAKKRVEVTFQPSAPSR